MCKILLMSCSLPPNATGSAVIIGNLLRWFGEDEIVLLSEQTPESTRGFGSQLKHPVIRVPTHPNPRIQEKLFRWARIPVLVTAGVRALRRHHCNALVTVFSDETFLLSGYFVHRMTQVPFFPYFHDLYLENRTGLKFQLACWLQPRVFAAASKVLTLNAGMATFYRNRYGIDAVVIPHSINWPIPDLPVSDTVNTSFVVTFIGKISYHNEENLRCLVEAASSMTNCQVRYYSASNANYVKSAGLLTENVVLDFAKDTEHLFAELCASDVLYLPLCFNCDGISLVEISTAFPTKTADYLATGRPILVHCPGDYFLASFFRQHGCGLVVDTLEPDALAVALGRLRDDAGLRRKLVHNALEVARQMRGKVVADRFRQVIEGHGCVIHDNDSSSDSRLW